MVCTRASAIPAADTANRSRSSTTSDASLPGASVPDVSQAHALLHGHEQEAFADAGYIGVDKRDEMKGKTVSLATVN